MLSHVGNIAIDRPLCPQERTLQRQIGMSAKEPKSDIGRLFDHFISTAGQRSSAAVSANCSLRPSAQRHRSQRFVYQPIEIARK
jgi:hypothetical protein